MAKGRKTIPSKILQLRGGTAHSHKKPRSDQEPKPPEKMPDCPAHLNEAARIEWERCGDILQAVGLMTGLDMAVFAGYCDAFAQWGEATIQIQKVGMVYAKGATLDPKTGKMIGGEPKLNPYLRVAKEAYDRMMRAAVLLGLSPSSRVNLKVEKPKPQSKAQAFMDRKNGGKG